MRPTHRRFISPVIYLLIFSPLFPSASGAVHKRPDPLHHFSDYAGGYDVRNKHYWASAAFTGVHGYLMAGAWLLCGLCFGLSYVLKSTVTASGNLSSPLHLDGHIHYLLLFLACLFTLLIALVGTAMVVVANRNFVEKTNSMKSTIEVAGNDVARAIRNSNNAMTRIQYLLLPYDPATSRQLNITTHRLGKESRSVQHFVLESGRAIDTSLQAASVSHVVVATLNFIFLLAALVLIFLHWPPGFTAIIISCWILTAFCCVLTGFDFFLHTFADDTCSAMGDYVRDPYNSSLSALLPCMNRTSADKALKGVSSIIHNFIIQLNLKITEVSEELGSDGPNDDAPENLEICNPFSGPPSYHYAPQNCTNDTLRVGEIPKMLLRFTCREKMSPTKCTKEGRFIPEYAYLRASAYSNAVQDILNIFLELQSLTQCRMVDSALSDVVSRQCRPFQVSTRLLWESMLSLSICMMVCILTWVFRVHQENGRSFSSWSIFPNDQIRQGDSSERVGSEQQVVQQP